jgi:hypothetical protein
MSAPHYGKGVNVGYYASLNLTGYMNGNLVGNSTYNFGSLDTSYAFPSSGSIIYFRHYPADVVSGVGTGTVYLRIDGVGAGNYGIFSTMYFFYKDGSGNIVNHASYTRASADWTQTTATGVSWKWVTGSYTPFIADGAKVFVVFTNVPSPQTATQDTVFTDVTDGIPSVEYFSTLTTVSIAGDYCTFPGASSDNGGSFRLYNNFLGAFGPWGSGFSIIRNGDYAQVSVNSGTAGTTRNTTLLLGGQTRDTFSVTVPTPPSGSILNAGGSVTEGVNSLIAIQFETNTATNWYWEITRNSGSNDGGTDVSPMSGSFTSAGQTIAQVNITNDSTSEIAWGGEVFTVSLYLGTNNSGTLQDTGTFTVFDNDTGVSNISPSQQAIAYPAKFFTVSWDFYGVGTASVPWRIISSHTGGIVAAGSMAVNTSGVSADVTDSLPPSGLGLGYVYYLEVYNGETWLSAGDFYVERDFIPEPGVHGFQVKNASNQLLIDIYTKTNRFVTWGNVLVNANSSSNITVAGITNDGTWGVVTEQFWAGANLSTSFSTNTLTITNNQSGSIYVTYYVYKLA